MNKENFYSLISNATALDSVTQQELEAIVDEYPYFQAARLLYTKNLFSTDKDLYNKELGKTALVCADRRKLFYTIREEEYAIFMKDLREAADNEDKTQALLDSFVTSVDETDEALLLVNPDTHIVSTDYFAYLHSLGTESDTSLRKETEPMRYQEIIDSFIEKAASDEVFVPSKLKEHNAAQVIDRESGDDEFLSETLTRVYIKQKKYDKALTIIKRLSLNFPQKSVYFADQIRFLELLIQNETSNKGGTPHKPKQHNTAT